MATALDLRGQPFGKWLVLYKGQQTAHGQFWVCQCACSPATVELAEEALVQGWTRSCGCDYVNTRGEQRARVDLVGRQIGRRLILQYHPKHGSKRAQYLCRCLCGKVQEVDG